MNIIANIIGCGFGVTESMLLSDAYATMVKADGGEVNSIAITSTVLEYLLNTQIASSYAAYLVYYNLVKADSGQINNTQITQDVLNSLIN